MTFHTEKERSSKALSAVLVSLQALSALTFLDLSSTDAWLPLLPAKLQARSLTALALNVPTCAADALYHSFLLREIERQREGEMKCP